MKDVSRKGGIFGSAWNISGNPYLYSITVLFDILLRSYTFGNIHYKYAS